MTPEQAKKVLTMTVESLLDFTLVDAKFPDDMAGQIDKARSEAKDAISTMATKLTAANDQIATLTKDLADETAKRENMEGHPDVIAAKKKAAIEQAQTDLLRAKAAEDDAAKRLADLGPNERISL